MPTDSGENVYWVKQNDGVIVENCVPDAQNALLDLGKWFFEKTGKKLVCTAGTNGSHAGGEHSHANGYKLDLNDWYGPEGLGGEYFGYPLDSNGTQLLADFVSYGHSLGLGMSIEGDHVDVQTDGYEWTTNTSYGGYGNPNGNDVKMSPNNSAGPRNKLDSPRAHGFKERMKSEDVGTVEITPSGKTYCEPVYPDYIYVTGNIPNSSIENTTMSSKEGLKAANGDTALMTGEMMQDLTGLKINAFTTDQAQAMAQEPFNPKNSILEFKVPSAGKPLNNNDPYPVDLKIEELENHMPRVKQYELDYYTECPVSKDVSKAILSLSDYTEKRLVKLENILATVMRYVFGIGSRMFINCQYYGGQDTGAKGVGKCIRCLRDDRCGDGQVMQLDQCLSCSRYEPIIGQRYDLLSEVGANLAAIQDDIQMGYMNMEDYIDWVRVEKMHKNRKDAGLNYQNTKNRKKDEKDFKDIWDDGVKMGWKLTPVEQQKAQINWRQDINSQDKPSQKLDSNQKSNGLGGSGLNPKSTIDSGNNKENATKQEDFIKDVSSGKFDAEDKVPTGSGNTTVPKTVNVTGDNGKNTTITLPKWDDVKAIISSGESISSDSNISEALDTMASIGYEQTLQNECLSKCVDPNMAMAIITTISKGDPDVEGGLFGFGGGDITSQIKAGVEKLAELKDKYGKGDNTIGWVQSIKKWDDIMDIVNKEDSKFDKIWCGAMKKAGFSDSDMAFCPAVMKAYETIPTKKIGISQITSGNVKGAEFPFKTEQLDHVFFTKQYGITNYGSGVTTATDCIVLNLSAPEPVYSPVQGSVTTSNGETRVISSQTGYQYVFVGLADTFNDGGEGVLAGQKIGQCSDKLIVKCYDPNGSSLDPYTTWGLLQGKLSEDMSKSIGKFVEEESMRY